MKVVSRTAKALRTRQQLMEAALELFQQQGFDNTTMRQIAERAGFAVGAAYYYFRTKEELVLAFYAESQQAAEEHHQDSLEEHWSFEQRMHDLVWHRLELLRPYRRFIAVLTRHIDPRHPLSPFGRQTRELRHRSIQLIAEALAASRIKPSKTLAPHLPLLLWLYQMGIVFFWIHDSSPEQEKTRCLLEVSLAVAYTAIRLSRSPMLRKTNQGLKQLMTLIEEVLA